MTKGERTRLEIVRNAAPLFNTKGYEGTSLSDLMAATGLQKGGIYRHFASKEELAGEAFDYAWRRAFEKRLEGVVSDRGGEVLLVAGLGEGKEVELKLPGRFKLDMAVRGALKTAPGVVFVEDL